MKNIQSRWKDPQKKPGHQLAVPFVSIFNLPIYPPSNPVGHSTTIPHKNPIVTSPTNPVVKTSKSPTEKPTEQNENAPTVTQLAHVDSGPNL